MTARHCQQCHGALEERDGREIQAFPGIKYQYCPACGWSRAITSTPRPASPAVQARAKELGIDLEATTALAALRDAGP